MHIRISLGSKFKLQQTGYFISKKRILLVKNRWSEHQHWVLQIQISLGTKFQLKPAMCDFLDEICPKIVFLLRKKYYLTSPLNSAHLN